MPWELPALIGADIPHEGLQNLDPLALIRRAITPKTNSMFACLACLESAALEAVGTSTFALLCSAYHLKLIRC